MVFSSPVLKAYTNDEGIVFNIFGAHWLSHEDAWVRVLFEKGSPQPLRYIFSTGRISVNREKVKVMQSITALHNTALFRNSLEIAGHWSGFIEKDPDKIGCSLFKYFKKWKNQMHFKNGKRLWSSQNVIKKHSWSSISRPWKDRYS